MAKYSVHNNSQIALTKGHMTTKELFSNIVYLTLFVKTTLSDEYIDDNTELEKRATAYILNPSIH